MKEMWDKRYSSEEYVYGKEPNQFFKEVLSEVEIKGKILFPGEGEGRNAVYAAKKGLSVCAFDISTQAKNKALRFAESEKVQIQYEVGNIADLALKPESFDGVVLAFVHMPPAMRANFHREIAKLIKLGGIVILEAFSKNNFQNKLDNPSSGGPSKLEFLFSKEEIENDFQAFEIVKLEEIEILLNEGELHQGLSKVIRFIGKKK